MSIYNSIYKGSQMDSATGIILNSGITSGELQFLRNITAGTSVANKALVLDASSNIGTLNNLTSKLLTAEYLNLENLSADPTGTPSTGRIFLYFKNGKLWLKNESGQTTEFKLGQEKEEVFTDAIQVDFFHDLGNKYPITSVIVDDSDFEGQVTYLDSANLTVFFNSPQSGRVICRSIK